MNDPDDAGRENPYNLTVCNDCERSYGPGRRCRCNEPDDYDGHEEEDDPDYDPTLYETVSAPDPRDTMRDEQVEAMRYKR